MTGPELHDTHAVGGDRAALPDDLKFGDVLLSEDGLPLLVVGYNPGDLGLIDDAGVRHSVDSVVAVFGPLTRARIVPADAIVLERPDDDDQNIFTVTGMVRYEEQHPGEYFLLPVEARERAAWLALAADEAERGQG